MEKKAGLGNGVIGKWRKYSPQISTIQKVANALDIPVDKLLCDLGFIEEEETLFGVPVVESKKPELIPIKPQKKEQNEKEAPMQRLYLSNILYAQALAEVYTEVHKIANEETDGISKERNHIVAQIEEFLHKKMCDDLKDSWCF